MYDVSVGAQAEGHMWKKEDGFVGLALSFHIVGVLCIELNLSDLCSKCLSPQSHLAGPHNCF